MFRLWIRFVVYFLLVFVSLVVSTSAVNCLERLNSERTCSVKLCLVSYSSCVFVSFLYVSVPFTVDPLAACPVMFINY